VRPGPLELGVWARAWTRWLRFLQCRWPKHQGCHPAFSRLITGGSLQGLALAAELNGMPGPSHLLELKDKIPLTPDQVDKTQVLLDEMRKASIPTGERLIAAEKALEAAFVSGKVDETSLRRLLADTESARSELRFIHLSQHYKTVLFLKPEQIKRYNILRGYADDPCKNIPAGHNPEMYKRHMGCD